MLKINDTNYQHYKRLFEIAWNYIQSHPYFPSSLSDEASPINVLNRFEKKSMAMAKKGLKQAITDLVFWIKDWPENDRQVLNDKLKNEKLPTFNELEVIINDVPGKVMKRGKIKNVEEWYVVKEILDDTTSSISEDEREKLNKLFSDFEFNPKRTK